MTIPQSKISFPPLRFSPKVQSPSSSKQRTQLSPVVPTENLYYKINVSPDKLHSTNKPLIDGTLLHGIKRRKNSHPVIKPSCQQKYYCVYHADKEATYKAIIKEQMLFYCTKCSIHLADKGYPIDKIKKLPGQSPQKRRTLSGNITSFVSSNMQNSPRFRQIQGFLLNSNKIHASMQINFKKIQQLPHHYRNQQRIIEQFYDSLISHMIKLRNQNLLLLKAESRKYCQLGQIIQKQLQQMNSSIQSITTNISANIKYILEVISEEKFRECIYFYKDKVKSYSQKIQEQRNTLGQVTNYLQTDCNTTYKEMVQYINKTLGVTDSHIQNHSELITQTKNIQFNSFLQNPLQINHKNCTSSPRKSRQLQKSSQGP